MTIAVRVAPSPTGKLQAGNGRAALLNALFALKSGGTFLLRLDDTDRERSTEAFTEGIVTDLAWLGIAHQRFAKQSERFARYAEALETLKAKGLLYPCYETPEELDRKRKRQLARHMPPVYDRAALELSAEQRAAFETEGRRPHWRFKLERKPVTWTDLIRGDVTIDTGTLSDPVLIREDGQYLYTGPSVIDDIDFAITHVIRGEDHVVNTAAQIELFRALEAPVPQFAHYPMLLDADGQKLSKRAGSLSLEALRAEGYEPMAVASLLAKIGTSDPIEIRPSLEALAAEFAFEKIGHAPARFDEAELRHLNARLFHAMPYTEAAPRLSALGVGGGEAFWLAVRDNLTLLKDAARWWAVVTDPLPPQPLHPVAQTAADLLPHGALTEDSWAPWTKAVGAALGVKGKDLFMPLRLALTGAEQGPELKRLLPLIGRERVLARLRGERA
jgi:glutamyl-tRNA synthetase